MKNERKHTIMMTIEKFEPSGDKGSDNRAQGIADLIAEADAAIAETKIAGFGLECAKSARDQLAGTLADWQRLLLQIRDLAPNIKSAEEARGDAEQKLEAWSRVREAGSIDPEEALENERQVVIWKAALTKRRSLVSEVRTSSQSAMNKISSASQRISDRMRYMRTVATNHIRYFAGVDHEGLSGDDADVAGRVNGIDAGDLDALRSQALGYVLELHALDPAQLAKKSNWVRTEGITRAAFAKLVTGAFDGYQASRRSSRTEHLAIANQIEKDFGT